MKEYVVAITRYARDEGSVTIDDFLKRIYDRKEIELIGPSEGNLAFTVKYAGSVDDLYTALGYTPEQVHIESPVSRDHK